MEQVSLHISPDITTCWPKTAIGLLAYRVSVQNKNLAMWEHLTNSVTPPLVEELETRPISGYPRLVDGRKAYRAFGKDPSKHRTSAEALYRRLRQQKKLYQINSLVDTNNMVSIETGFPLGSYDMDRIDSCLELRLGREGEVYQSLGKGIVSLTSYPVLADEAGPFGSPTSDSMRAMISDGTTSALTVVYSFSGTEPLEEALKFTVDRLLAYAGMQEINQRIIVSSNKK